MARLRRVDQREAMRAVLQQCVYNLGDITTESSLTSHSDNKPRGVNAHTSHTVIDRRTKSGCVWLVGAVALPVPVTACVLIRCVSALCV